MGKKRFSRLKYAAQSLRAPNSDGAVPDAPAGSILKRYQDVASGKTILSIFLLKKIVDSAKINTCVWYIVFQQLQLLLQKTELNLNKFFSDKDKDKERKW